MSSPLEQAGATREPSEYATISMDRVITGLWTQRSPLRDADVPYVYGKFYSASRFDSLIDGINREMTARLTAARRCGTSPYNSNTFPAINSFYSYKRVVNGTEIVRVIADGADGTIYDATAGQKSTIFTKGAGAGKARFQGVNTTLFFTDGVENKKLLQPGPWIAQTSLTSTQFQVGTIIIDSDGSLEYLAAFQVGTVTNVQVASNVVILTFSGTNFSVVQGMSFTLNLGTATFLNGALLFATSVVASGGTFIVTASFAHAPYASTADSGPATTTDVGTPATTGGSVPAWFFVWGHRTTDGLSTWVCYNNFINDFMPPPVFDWQPPGPANPPTISAISNGTPMTIWQPLALMAAGSIVLAGNGLVNGSFTGGRTGNKLPPFSDAHWPSANPLVADGGTFWQASNWLGGGLAPAPWQKSTAVTSTNNPGGDCILDPNGNLQMAGAGSGSTGSGAQPTWNTTYGGTTTDSGLTWVNKGPYLALAFQGRKYAYALHCLDGSVSTLSPLSTFTNGVLDGVTLTGFGYGNVIGIGPGDDQVDAIWIFHTVDGDESDPLYLASIPNPGANILWTFNDQYDDSLLNPFIEGPQGEANNPPPIGMTAPVFHLQRIWAIFENTVVYSGGPNTLVGNGNTSFAPLNSIPYPEQPIKLVPITVNNGGLLVIGTTNVWIILGTGTANNPFYTTVYMPSVGIRSYDAVDLVGSTLYLMTAKGKAVSLDPSAGYVEFGFPIGDQFANVTTGKGALTATGAPTGALFSPSSTYVAWSEISSGDTGVYVSDGAVGWFRYSPVASPETGYMWSPRAVIVGGTSAVQSVETTSGVSQLLIGPATSGPILFRDSTVNQDWFTGAYHSYPSYDTKGNIVLCQSGEVAEIAHIAVKSIAVGARPKVGLLLGEIAPTPKVPFDWLDITSADPPNLPPSVTMYSDRYTALQNGVCPKCDNFQLALDYGTQNAADETLMFSVYGAKYAERKQQ